jgi:hypothetical protein
VNELQKKQKELSDLHERHQQEFVVLFRELKELLKSLARNCEHDFQYEFGTSVCIKCGIDREYYTGRSWQ